VRRAIHAIKEMGLNTKFKEAIDAVDAVTLDLVIAKSSYNHKLKKGEGDNLPPAGSWSRQGGFCQAQKAQDGRG
jgi:hypothetical protein